MAKIKKSKCKFCKSETEYLLDSSGENAKRLLSAIEQLGKEKAYEVDCITPQILFDLGFEESYQEPEDGQVGFLYYFICEDKYGIDILSNEGGTEVEIGGWLKVKDVGLIADFIDALDSIKDSDNANYVKENFATWGEE